MLKRASVADLKSGAVSRAQGYVAITMRFYPRFVSKDLRDEYIRALAPDAKLFSEFKKKQRELGDHNRAFELVDYESRFSLSEEGLFHLKRLSEKAEKQDVYLVCQCKKSERCHVEILLTIASHKFGAKTEQLTHSYPTYLRRLAHPTADSGVA